jgi:hypothetical protein
MISASPVLDKSGSPDPATPSSRTVEKGKTENRKFHNGWTQSLERLVAEWADKASCYQWMHQKTEVKYQRFNMYFTIPVIIMSTLTGTANFATDSIVDNPDNKKFVTFGIGAISLIAGIISTVANFLRYAQGSEAHRVAAISWGKFQRFISIELSLHPNERMDAMSFLKMGRVELDRLIEQSPPIPPKIIQAFMIAFKDKRDIRRPEIVGGIEHTSIFDDRESRLAKIASEAAYIIQQKKGLMRQLVLEDIDQQIVRRTREERVQMEERLRHEIMSSAKEVALATMRVPLVNQSNASRSFATGSQDAVNMVRAGTVAKNRERFGAPPAAAATTSVPAGIVEAAREKLLNTGMASRLDAVGGGYTIERGSKKFVTVASGIAQAAAQVAAARFATTESENASQASAARSPSSYVSEHMKIKIIDSVNDIDDMEHDDLEKELAEEREQQERLELQEQQELESVNDITEMNTLGTSKRRPSKAQ